MRKVGRCIIGILVLGLAPGCSATASDTTSPKEKVEFTAVADQYGYDMETAKYTPTYALVPEYMDPRDGYARDLLARRCLQGVVDYKPITLGISNDVADERTGQPLFNADIASRLGYSARRLQQRPDDAVPDNADITPAIEKSMKSCGVQADKRLGKPPVALLGRIETAGWDALVTDPAMKKTNAEWKTCMQPAGIVDLPDKPDEMPSPSIASAGSQTADENGNITYSSSVPPSKREIEVAELDAQCRTKVDYDRVMLRERATAELKNIGRNLDQFEAVRVEYQRYGKGADKVIAELG